MTNICIQQEHNFKGFYQLTLVGEDGNIREQTEWFENLITNDGLDQIYNTGSYGFSFGVAQMVGTAFVGTGNTPPTNTDTAMTTLLATNGPYTNGVPTSNNLYVSGPPAYWTQTFTYTFATGAAAGTLSEVGVGYTTNGTGGYRLFSHALIVDGAGAPTTITVLSTDQLILSYTLRDYINLTTQTGSMLISGVTYALSWLPAAVGTPVSMTHPVASVGVVNTSATAYQGPIGTVTTNPAGLSQPIPSVSFSSYSTGNYFITATFSALVSEANLSGGIGAITVQTPFHSFQVGFTPNIPKTSSNALSISINISWARYP